MRFISTKTHGVLDYLMGTLLIAAPWLLGFYRGGAESWVPIILGAMMIVMSLMTDYEMGAARVLSMRTHLTMDFISGALLAASPWLFGFADYIYWPHLVLGIAEIGASLVTHTTPQSSGHRNETRGRMQHGGAL